jgi:hypothetical protein
MGAVHVIAARAIVAVAGRTETSSRTLQVILTSGALAHLVYPSDGEMVRNLSIRSDVAEIVRVL